LFCLYVKFIENCSALRQNLTMVFSLFLLMSTLIFIFFCWFIHLFFFSVQIRLFTRQVTDHRWSNWISHMRPIPALLNDPFRRCFWGFPGLFHIPKSESHFRRTSGRSEKTIRRNAILCSNDWSDNDRHHCMQLRFLFLSHSKLLKTGLLCFFRLSGSYLIPFFSLIVSNFVEFLQVVE